MKCKLDDFAALWSCDAKNYVLVVLESGVLRPRSCLIFDRKTRTALVIEEDEVAQAVILRMVEAGVEIVPSVPEG